MKNFKIFFLAIIIFLAFAKISPVLASITRIQSNSVVTRVGNIVGPAPGGDFASQLANAIISSASCVSGGIWGIVNLNNVTDCNDSIRLKISPPQNNIESVLSEIYFSVTAVQGGVLQCVGFVQAVFAGITGQILDKTVPIARLYRYNAPPGYTFVDKSAGGIIKPGDMAIWEEAAPVVGPAGHIAYVIGVYNDSAFQIAEANWGKRGLVETRDVRITDPGFAGWLHQQ